MSASMRSFRFFANVTLSLIFMLSFVGLSFAQVNNDSESKKPSLPNSYIFLPKNVRWGCLACHSDQKLTKLDRKTGEEKSLYVDKNIIGNSVHKRIACLDCHENFSYKGHPKEVPRHYRRVAGLACKKCHPYQYQRYQQSVHGKLIARNSRKKAPICADCHGSHGIQKVTTKKGDLLFRAESRWACSRCHKNRTVSLNDYYHGAAYKRGEPDAPACWDCHDSHGVKGKNDSGSTVHKDNLPTTCGKCHTDTSQSFTGYAKMMHGRNRLLANNFIANLYYNFFPEKSLTVEEVTKPTENLKPPKVAESNSLLQKITDIFFPKSLRPRKVSE